MACITFKITVNCRGTKMFTSVVGCRTADREGIKQYVLAMLVAMLSRSLEAFRKVLLE